MDELYEYLKEKRDQMYSRCITEIDIDMNHLFKLFQAVCFLRQIKNIVNYEEDMERILEQMQYRD